MEMQTARSTFQPAQACARLLDMPALFLKSLLFVFACVLWTALPGAKPG